MDSQDGASSSSGKLAEPTDSVATASHSDTTKEDQSPWLESKPSADDFNFISPIGIGNCARVLLAEYKNSKRLYAIKILKKGSLISNSEEENAPREKRVLNCVNEDNHPLIVRLFATFQSETRLFFVTEYVPGGNLMWYIQRQAFSQKQAQFYAAEICLALKYLHEKGILHRDLSLDNIMLALDGHIKVIGFGMCKEDMRYGTTTSTFCGNAEFMAPEILQDKPYTFAVDWWALGIVLYQMNFQQSPFVGEDEDEIYDGILADDPVYPPDSPPNTIAICQGLLAKKPEERLGSGPTDAEELMIHPYFNGMDWDGLYHRRVPAPYIPRISNDKDTSNFDGEVTSEPVQDVLSDSMQAEFEGFEGF